MKEGYIYIYSIKEMNICNKINFNDLLYCEVILKLNDNKFISLGFVDNSIDIILLYYEKEKNNINTIGKYKNAHSDIKQIESILSLNNRVFLTSDCSGNIKIWSLNKNG